MKYLLFMVTLCAIGAYFQYLWNFSRDFIGFEKSSLVSSSNPDGAHR